MKKFQIIISGLFILTSLLSSFFLSRSCAQQDPNFSPWPMFGQNPQNTFRSPFAAAAQKPARPEWRFTSPGGHGISSPVAVGKDGTLFFGTWKNGAFAKNKMQGHSGVLMALTPEGEVKWSHDSGRGSFLASGIESSPVVLDNGMVIYGKDDGYVYCLNKHGELVWEVPLDDPFDPQNPYDDNEQVIPSPVPGPDHRTLYLCTHWSNLYNPDAVERILRRVPPDQRHQISIKGTRKDKWGKLYAIDIQDGVIRWTYDPSLDPPNAYGKKYTFGSPAVSHDGTVYFSCFDKKNGYLYALNPDGTLKWRYPALQEESSLKKLTSSVSIAKDGTVYVGSFDFTGQASVYAFILTPVNKFKQMV
jgi:outer membrane protein assembly factor BamB